VTAIDRILIADFVERNPFRSILAEQQRHTTTIDLSTGISPTVGMAQPRDDDSDTSSYGGNGTIVYTIERPRISYAYSEIYTTATTWTSCGGDPLTEAERQKAWKAYWTGLYRKPREPKARGSKFFSAVRGIVRIPGVAELRKKALSPATRSHRRFMTKMMKPVSPRCC